MKAGSSLGILALTASLVACSSGGQCPTIDCVPRLTGIYANPISRPYRLAIDLNVTTSVSFVTVSFAANCPMAIADLGTTPGIQSCDDRQFVVTGLDLGHWDNLFVNVNAGIDNAFPINTSAELRGITNSRDCKLVCYEHVALIPN